MENQKFEFFLKASSAERGKSKHVGVFIFQLYLLGAGNFNFHNDKI